MAGIWYITVTLSNVFKNTPTPLLFANLFQYTSAVHVHVYVVCLTQAVPHHLSLISLKYLALSSTAFD